MIAPLSKTRCEPSVMAGMRPLGLIFRNQLLINQSCSIQFRWVGGVGEPHSSF